MTSERKRAHLVISGRVQGVWYRGSAREAARRLGLVGWIRNNYNGDVEGVVEGGTESIDEFIKWCRKGPPHARVENVDVTWEKPTGEFRDFRISYDH